jgi:lipoprotein-anchoring transpeptidase ErfK/SrfK
MIWRVALASAALASLAAPATAQWYPGGYYERPYYYDRPYYDDRSYYYGNRGYWGRPRRDHYYDPEGGYDRYQPEDNRGWEDQRGNGEDRYYDPRQQPQQQIEPRGGYGVVRNGGPRPFITPKAPPRIEFHSSFAPRSIVIDTAGRKLYFILSPNEAYEYPISVGREGFAWTGNEVISRRQEWPDWYPPKEMMARDSRVPEKMTGGVNNPLGALALYLGKTLYRIHGTNDPNSLGRAASSGCFRMMNEHVLHLASLAPIGTPVAVVKHLPVSVQSAATRPRGGYDDGYAPRPYNRYVPQRY